MATARSSTAMFVNPLILGLEIELELEDATQKNLKQFLKLPRFPNALIDRETHRVFLFKGTRTAIDNLTPGAVYEVQLDEDAGDAAVTDEKLENAPSTGEVDIQRAMMCCQAIYQDGPKKVKQFLNKRENLVLHNFGEVCVSKYGRLTYMLAETNDKDELFIAFRGTRSYEDILSDLSFWQSPCADDESSMGGNCHAGFLKLASCFPINPILRRYVYGREVDKCARIVVCGHSMGGAVAHIVTLNLLADLKRHGRDTENIISIAIGAPYFGDREMRDYVEKHNLSNNLLTIVNQDDPVPRLLQLAEGFHCVAKVGSQKLKGIATKILPTIKNILDVLPGIGFGGQVLKVAAAVVATVEEQLPTFLKKMSQSLVGFGQELEDALKYTPLGRYMILTHQRLPGAGQKTQWYVTHMETAEEVMKTMRDTWKEEVSVNRMNEHKIIEYAAIYPKTTELGQLTTFELNVMTQNEDWYGKDPKTREVVSSKPFPLYIEEERVSLTIVGPDASASRKQKQLRITINGQHLDFFTLQEKPFSGIPADMDKGIQTDVSADEVIFKCEMVENMDFDAVPVVHFTTHFEKRDLRITSKMIKEAKALTLAESVVNSFHPAVLIKAIRRSLSTILLAQNRKQAMKSDVILKLIKRLAGKEAVKLSTMIDEASHLDDMDTKYLGKVVQEIILRLGDYLEVMYPSRPLSETMKRYFGMGGVAGIIAAKSGNAAVIFGAIATTLDVAKNYVGPKVLAWYRRRTFRSGCIEKNYEAILRMLIQELPKIQSEQDSDVVDDGNLYTLERALYRKFSALGYLNKDVEANVDKNPFCASKKLKDASKESQREVLRRCQMACDLFEIRQHLRKSCFVGLFGPQNSGKSTLIQKVWGLDVPDVGYLAHTTTSNLYKANGTDRMVIIDFPGTTAIDEQVANLANTCGGLSSILILVMKFDGDTSTDHVQQLKEARKLADDFNCCILLCISHCGLYKGTLEDRETVDTYRENYRQHLELDPANILMAELEENTDDLESRGIVGPDGVRMWLKDWLIKYDVFEDDEDQLHAAVNM
ncbi:uncharacterized protein LOC144878240 [Branchiostoma floridae x Branchiostoma japonicum]